MSTDGLSERAPSRGAGYTLHLLGGFNLMIDGRSFHLPRAEQRVLACLALDDRPQPRSRLAGRLWPDAAEPRAMARLRTSLWRLRQPGRLLIDGTSDTVRLGEDVVVDVQELTALVHRFLDAPIDADAPPLTELAGAGELLPEWEDEWLAPQRERFRQIRLHALERLGERLAQEGRFGRAVEVSLAVVADDPLRESAQRVLIKVYAAEGNVHEAISQYLAYRSVMRDELGLEPSVQMETLIDELGIRAVRSRA
ncbi:MAG: AfsR/SARP family transcriptional regulator [Candidatus Limnocylindrales bacterium]